MATNKTILNIEINENVNDYITAVQQDSRSRFLDVMLFDNGVPIDLTGHTARIYAIKPDGKEVYNNGVITDAKNGRVQFELTSQTLAVSGLLNLQIILYRNNTEILSTNPFKLFILESLMSKNAIQSSNEYGALVVTLRDLESAKALMQEMVKKIGSPGQIATSLNLTTMYGIMDEILKMLRDSSVAGLNTKLDELKTKSDNIASKIDEVKEDTEKIIDERGTCIDLPNLEHRVGSITLRNGEHTPNKEYSVTATSAGTRGRLIDCIITASFGSTSGITYPKTYSERNYTVTVKIDGVSTYQFKLNFKGQTLNSSPPRTTYPFRTGFINAQQLISLADMYPTSSGKGEFNRNCTHFNCLGNGINFAINKNFRRFDPRTLAGTNLPKVISSGTLDISSANFNGEFDNVIPYSRDSGIPFTDKIEVTISADTLDEFSPFHSFRVYFVNSRDNVRLFEWD